MPYSFFKNTPRLLKRRIASRFGVKPLRESQGDIQAWFKGPLGQRLLKCEQSKLDRIMPEMYGYHLMQLSAVDHALALSRQSPASHHFSLDVKIESGAPAIAEYERLPIAAEAIDVALLHHALEYSPNPHQLLRDVARTIIPNGYIVIVGFNPWSFSTLKRQLGRLVSHNAQRRFHTLRRSRLIDWLQLLDFEPVLLEYGYHGWPVEQHYIKQFEHHLNSLFPVCGSFYIVVARKSITPMTVIKPEWKKISPLPSWANRPLAQQSQNNAIKNRKH